MSSAATMTDLAGADCVYFLMFEGWSRELRSNRWHYATRWARHLPVVLVQPVLTSDFQPSTSYPEPRIPNVRVLHIRAGDSRSGGLTTGPLQARQLYDDMQAHGFKRPIFWTYNPDYVFASELLPAALRVFHATENYFYFSDLSPGFLERIKRLLSISPLVIGVSEGVVASHRPFTPGIAKAITNGCDYSFYSQGGHDAALAELAKGWSKIAIYVGNINGRLDFALLDRAASANPGVLFTFFGPVSGIAGTPDLERWNSLIARTNVRYEGPADIERLPALFATAHVGLIPYKSDPILVDNTFPLKAFEMQSTGLPVVSTFMHALQNETGPGLRIAGDVVDFATLVERLDRRGLTPGESAEILIKSKSHDYDAKFEAVLELVTGYFAKERALTAPALELHGLGSLMEQPQRLQKLYEDASPRHISLASVIRIEFMRLIRAATGLGRSLVLYPLKVFIKKRFLS